MVEARAKASKEIEKGREGLVSSKDRQETDVARSIQPEGEGHTTELEGIIMHELCRSR